MLLTNETSLHRNTVLFVDGTPVGYQIFQEGAGFRLQPDDLLAPFTNAPAIRARRAEDRWLFEPQLDRDLAAQVEEDLEQFAGRVKA